MPTNKTLARSLQQWHQALAQIPQKTKRLLSSPTSTNEQRFRAWQGDKILGAAAARAVEKVTDIRSSGDATKLTSKALSNHFFAANVATLLPGFPVSSNAVSQHFNPRRLGSILEAVVAQVESSGSPSRKVSQKAAIAELAEWLVATANGEESSLSTLSNPKKAASLLELDGSVVQSRQVGGMPHQPSFEATAAWKQIKVAHVATARKKVVERRAADMLRIAAEFIKQPSLLSSESSSSLDNPKGRLSQLGGKFHSRQVGGKPHRPLFEVTAKSPSAGSLKVSVILEGTGRKKDVERTAVEILLAVMDQNPHL